MSRFGSWISLVVMVGALVLASCSSTSTQEKSTTTAKPSGSLVVEGKSSGMEAMDPTVMGSATNYQYLSAAVFESLVDVGHDGKYRPCLAERWEISQDGLTHTFYIRKGVKFHDGSDMTGADVKFSYERILAPDSTNLDSPTLRNVISSIDLKDDYTVVFHMKTPLFELLKGLTDFGNSGVVVPKKYIEAKGVAYFRNNPVGTGPWKVVKFEPSVEADLEAVENHWRETPRFKNVKVIRVADDAAKVAMVKTGELDLAEISPDQIDGVRASGLKIVSFDGGVQHHVVPFYDLDNPDQHAFGNKNVRKALSLAINRTELSNSLMKGYAEPSGIYFVRAAYFGNPDALKPDPYDPDQAKKLLAEAGYPMGFNAKIWMLTGFPIQNDINMGMVGHWGKVGINMEAVPIEAMAARALFFPKMKPEMFGTLYNGVHPGGIIGIEKISVPYHSTTGALKNLRDPQLDNLIDKISSTLDPAEKKRIGLEAAIRAKNGYNSIPVVNLKTILAVSKKIGDLPLTDGFSTYAYNLSSIVPAK